MSKIEYSEKRPTVYEVRTPRGLLYAIILLLSGCTTNISGDFCDIYQPVYADYQNDTAETIRQVDLNNVVFDSLCN